MCCKCTDGLFARDIRGAHYGQEFRGCRVDSRITDYDAAEVMCPLNVEDRLNSNIKVMTETLNNMRRLKPVTWCVMFGVEVIDPDGWRDNKSNWETPITRDMFLARYRISTTRVVNRARYLQWRHLF